MASSAVEQGCLTGAQLAWRDSGQGLLCAESGMGKLACGSLSDECPAEGPCCRQDVP